MDRLRQPRSKQRGSATGETLSQCIRGWFSNLAPRSGKHPEQKLGHALHPAEPGDNRIISSCGNMNFSRTERGEENSIRVRKLV